MLIIASCAKVPTINTKEHYFNNTPEQVVVIQVKGIDIESFAPLKYSMTNSQEKLGVEKFTCLGQAWRFNHTNLRPSLEDSFFSQISGHPRSEKSCEKYESSPLLWEVFSKNGFTNFYLQQGSDNFIDEVKACNANHLSEVSVFLSSENKSSSQSFHFEKSKEYQKGQIYTDESCVKNGCYSNLKNNFNHIWYSNNKTNKKLLVVRDLTMNSKNIDEMNDFINYLHSDFQSKNPRALIVLTASDPAKNYANVWASGPMSENFCGQYNEFEVFNRIFWQTTKTRLLLLDF